MSSVMHSDENRCFHALTSQKKGGGNNSATNGYLVKVSTYSSVHRKNHSSEASYNQSVGEQMMAVGRMSSIAMNHK